MASSLRIVRLPWSKQVLRYLRPRGGLSGSMVGQLDLIIHAAAGDRAGPPEQPRMACSMRLLTTCAPRGSGAGTQPAPMAPPVEELCWAVVLPRHPILLQRVLQALQQSGAWCSREGSQQHSIHIPSLQHCAGRLRTLQSGDQACRAYAATCQLCHNKALLHVPTCGPPNTTSRWRKGASRSSHGGVCSPRSVVGGGRQRDSTVEPWLHMYRLPPAEQHAVHCTQPAMRQPVTHCPAAVIECPAAGPT